MFYMLLGQYDGQAEFKNRTMLFKFNELYTSLYQKGTEI